MQEQIGTYIWVAPLFLLYACQWYTFIHHGGHYIHKWHTHDSSVEEVWAHVEDCTHGQATSTPALQTATQHIIHSSEAVLQDLSTDHVHQACKCCLACFLSEILDTLTGEHQRPGIECIGHAADTLLSVHKKQSCCYEMRSKLHCSVHSAWLHGIDCNGQGFSTDTRRFQSLTPSSLSSSYLNAQVGWAGVLLFHQILCTGYEVCEGVLLV